MWLLGKVQSGKTSIIRVLTQATDAEIGNGFRACTKTARVFDFPEEAPIIRFLDTRGLGEAAYEPAEDIAFCEGRVAPDPGGGQGARPSAAGGAGCASAAARRRHPDWPVVVAQTSLHEGYPHRAAGHVLPYPVRRRRAAAAAAASRWRGRSAYQRALFEALPGRGALSFVPIDFTQPGDGFEPADYGREALVEALIVAAPAAVAVALAELPRAPRRRPRKSDAHILGFAAGRRRRRCPSRCRRRRRAAGAGGHAAPARPSSRRAAGTGAPMPSLPARSAPARWCALPRASACASWSSSIPVYGQTAGAAAAAAASFATTYAMGKAASYFLARRRQGVDARRGCFRLPQALRDAFRMAKERDDRRRRDGGKP